MGLTFTHALVSNPRRARAPELDVELLVDTGAIYSVLPGNVLRRLGIKPMQREQFTLADGTKQIYPIGEAFFRLGERVGTSKVVFAPPGTTPLLGALTLESLGLMVNPVTRELRPMNLILAASRAATRRARDS